MVGLITTGTIIVFGLPCLYGHYVPYELIGLIEGLHSNDVCVHMM